jgi:hypothetical protein
MNGHVCMQKGRKMGKKIFKLVTFPSKGVIPNQLSCSFLYLNKYYLLEINSPYKLSRFWAQSPQGSQSKNRRHSPMKTLFHSHKNLLKVWIRER